MKAIVKKFAQEGLWMEDIPIPYLGDNEVRIKPKSPPSAALTLTSINGVLGHKKMSQSLR